MIAVASRRLAGERARASDHVERARRQPAERSPEAALRRPVRRSHEPAHPGPALNSARGRLSRTAPAAAAQHRAFEALPRPRSSQRRRLRGVFFARAFAPPHPDVENAADELAAKFLLE